MTGIEVSILGAVMDTGTGRFDLQKIDACQSSFSREPLHVSES